MRGIVMKETDVQPWKAIKNYLYKKGISQIYISRNTGIDAVKLSASLNGKRQLTLDEYALICGVLGVNTDYFLKPRLPDKEVG